MMVRSFPASELDLDVHVRRQVESHERVDGLRRGIDDVDQALVGAHLEVLAAVLVLVRRTDDAEDVLLRRQRHRAHDRRARAGHRVDDLARRAVDDLVVVRLEPDADLLSRHGVVLPLSLLRGSPTPALGRVALGDTPDAAHPKAPGRWFGVRFGLAVRASPTPSVWLPDASRLLGNLDSVPDNRNRRQLGSALL